MTRKDFELIAATLKYSRPRYVRPTEDAAEMVNACWRSVCEDMADALLTTNSRFDREQFLLACGAETDIEVRS